MAIHVGQEYPIVFGDPVFSRDRFPLWFQEADNADNGFVGPYSEGGGVRFGIYERPGPPKFFIISPPFQKAPNQNTGISQGTTSNTDLSQVLPSIAYNAYWRKRLTEYRGELEELLGTSVSLGGQVYTLVDVEGPFPASGTFFGYKRDALDVIAGNAGVDGSIQVGPRRLASLTVPTSPVYSPLNNLTNSCIQTWRRSLVSL